MWYNSRIIKRTKNIIELTTAAASSEWNEEVTVSWCPRIEQVE